MGGEGYFDLFVRLTNLDWNAGADGIANISLVSVSVVNPGDYDYVNAGLQATLTGNNQIDIDFVTDLDYLISAYFDEITLNYDVTLSSPTPIPEPATYLLLGSMAMVVAYTRRRKLQV